MLNSIIIVDTHLFSRGSPFPLAEHWYQKQNGNYQGKWSTTKPLTLCIKSRKTDSSRFVLAVRSDLSLFLTEYSISKAGIIELQDIRICNLEGTLENI